MLVRGPYGRGFPFALVFARLYAARGYHVVLQSVRGTFGSAGVFEPMVNEAADGADTVVWLREQPWFTGRFATIGLSYLGFTQWALLRDPPPELAAAVITAGPHDLFSSVWGTGSFAVNDFLGWCDLVSHQEDPGASRPGSASCWAPRRVARAAAGELADGCRGPDAARRRCAVVRIVGRTLRLRRSVLGSDAVPGALDRVQVPVLLLGGWQDIFLRQTLQQYRHLRDRDVDVAMTIGPWTHTQLLSKGLATGVQESLDWLDTHLGGRAALQRPSAVRVFVSGQGWRNLPDWPPATTNRVLYLQPGGRLGETAPAADTPPATFRCDPVDPTPTIGGPLLSFNGGYRNDSRLALRDDVLDFTGATLTHDLPVYGNPVIELAHTSDNPHVDVFVRVSEVAANGRSRNVSDAYRRLGTAQKVQNGAELVSIELDAIAHRFRAGSRIRVLVAGSWFPRYARNLGTEEAVLTGLQLKPATHSVHFGRSRLLLPAGSPDPSADGVADPDSHLG